MTSVYLSTHPSWSPGCTDLHDVTGPQGNCRVEVVTETLQLPCTLRLRMAVLRVASQRVVLRLFFYTTYKHPFGLTYVMTICKPNTQAHTWLTICNEWPYIYTQHAILFVCCCFMSYQHLVISGRVPTCDSMHSVLPHWETRLLYILRSYQDGYQLVTVHTHGDFIVAATWYWETR